VNKTADPYLQAFQSGFSGILRWPQLDVLWDTLRDDTDGGWYVYAVGQPPPELPSSPQDLSRFIAEVDVLLRRDHEEDYCGIVYADDRERPRFIKIYDPNNLGVVCGSSEAPPLPGWTLSKLKPLDLPGALPPPGNRKRWWRRLFG
jgi:hypothetical protein